MVFSYELLDKGNEIGFDLYYGALALPDQQIMHKIFTEPTGHIDFSADNDGYYSYCLQLPPTSTEPAVRFQMTLNYGFDSDYYEKLAKKYDYDAINLQVHKLNDMLTLTLNEADYQKHKEVEYHDVTEKMNNAALWWPVLQVSECMILLCTTILCAMRVPLRYCCCHSIVRSENRLTKSFSSLLHCTADWNPDCGGRVPGTTPEDLFQAEQAYLI